MAQILQDKKGKVWWVNKNNIKQLCFAWDRAGLLMKFSHVRTQSFPVNLMWTMNTATIDVNWKQVNDIAASQAFDSRDKILRDFLEDGNLAIENLASMRSQTRRWLDQYYDKIKEADDINRANINQMGENAEMAKLVRNVGASAVVACSAVVAAPAAAAGGLATGALLKGAAKYQDTGNVGSAIVDAACEVIVGVTGLKIAKAAGDLSRGGQIVVSFFLKAPMEFGKSIISGDSVPQATVSALIEGMNMPWLQEGVGALLAKIPVPVILKTVAGKVAAGAKTDFGEVAKGTAESVSMDKAKDQAKSEISGGDQSRPGTTLKAAYIDAGFINLMAKDSDKKYIQEFCIKPYQSH